MGVENQTLEELKKRLESANLEIANDRNRIKNIEDTIIVLEKELEKLEIDYNEVKGKQLLKENPSKYFRPIKLNHLKALGISSGLGSIIALIPFLISNSTSLEIFLVAPIVGSIYLTGNYFNVTKDIRKEIKKTNLFEIDAELSEIETKKLGLETEIKELKEEKNNKWVRIRENGSLIYMLNSEIRYAEEAEETKTADKPKQFIKKEKNNK